MKDVKTYKAAPPKLIGMKVADMWKYVKVNDLRPTRIHREDGTNKIVPWDLHIALNIENGIVVGSELDGQSYGKW